MIKYIEDDKNIYIRGYSWIKFATVSWNLHIFIMHG